MFSARELPEKEFNFLRNETEQKIFRSRDVNITKIKFYFHLAMQCLLFLLLKEKDDVETTYFHSL